MHAGGKLAGPVCPDEVTSTRVAFCSAPRSRELTRFRATEFSRFSRSCQAGEAED